MSRSSISGRCTSVFEFGGSCFRLLCPEEELHDILGEDTDVTGAGDVELEIEISVNRQLASGNRERALFRGRGHLVVAVFDEEVFVFDLLRRKVHASVSTETCRSLSFWRGLLLPIALGVLGPTVGVIPVHAACLKADRGVMLVGNSGAGKSTLSVALAKRGWNFISDDWTYLKAKEGGLVANGVGAPVKLLPDAKNHFPELGSLVPQRSLNGELAFEVDSTAVLNLRKMTSTKPQLVIFIDRGSSAERLEPISQEEVFGYFSQSLERLPTALSNVEATRERTIRELSKLDAFQYCYQGTPDEGASRLEHLLMELQR